MSKFEALPVTRSFTDSVVTPSAGDVESNYSLKIDAGTSLSEVFVINGNFDMVARGQGTLDAKLPAGEYLVKYRAGDRYAETWVTLDQDRVLAESQAPIANTVAPIAESVGWSDGEAQFAERMRKTHSLSIVIRDPNGIPPSDDVRIRKIDGTTVAQLADLSASGWEGGTETNVRGMGGTVETGGYIVVISTPGLRPYCMPLWVAPNCSTQLFMERRTLGMRGKRRIGPQLASASILVLGKLVPWFEAKRLLGLAETAKSVLSYDRALVPETSEILQSLEEKFSCPILGLLAAHLLRIKYEEQKTKDENAASKLRTLLQTVVQSLAQLMPGSPDVGALQLALGLPTTGADFTVPPMLAHSWAILADSTASALPLGSYADRIRPAVCATRPWLIWDKSRMIPEAGRLVRKRKESTKVMLPPEIHEAVSQLGKHLKFGLGPDGRMTVMRK